MGVVTQNGDYTLLALQKDSGAVSFSFDKNAGFKGYKVLTQNPGFIVCTGNEAYYLKSVDVNRDLYCLVKIKL